MVIITGANGFVGQELAPRLLKHFKISEILFLVGKGDTALNRQGTRILKNLGAKTLEVNLVTGQNMEKIPSSPSLVIHMASQTDTSKVDHRANDIGTANFLKAIAPLNSRTHLIFTSTAVSFSGRKDCSHPINENEKPSPTNKYGRTKLEAEKELIEYVNKFNCRLTMLRISTVYGKDPREYKMFKELKKHILKQTIIARLNWPGKTGIIHVDDVVQTLLKIIKTPPGSNKININLLSAESLTFSQIIKIMHNAMGIKYNPISLPKYLWKLIAHSRKFTPLIEKITTPQIYNLFWRFSLIIDNVIDVKSNKIFTEKYKFRKFSKLVKDVIQ